MEPAAPLVPNCVRRRAAVVRSRRAQKYRALLLRDAGNNRLRKRYLDDRTTDLAAADMRLANHRLALAGALTSAMVVMLVGACGGVVGALLLMKAGRPTGGIGAALALGMGSVLCGALGCAVLALRGWVLFADLIGEVESLDESSHGVGGAMTAALIEAWGGLLWGTVCGVCIGIVGGVLCGVLGFVPAAWGGMSATGAASALLVGAGAATAQVLAVYLRGPNAVARDWARLGPLPLFAYAFSFPCARRRYLR